MINGGADPKGGGADALTVQNRFEATLDGGAGSLSEAVARVEADARDGLPAASHLLATLAAAGIGMPQSWSAALGHLTNAARGGSTSARGQLEVLGSDKGAAGDDPWTALAASTGIADWTAPCQKRVINTSPRTVAIKGFLPKGRLRLADRSGEGTGQAGPGLQSRRLTHGRSGGSQ